jgi:hypothetical protein
MVTEFPTVTDDILMGTVPLMDAVTDPIWFVPATRAGSELMVRELPTVTDEMDIGTVPLIDAVTLPICAVPATNAGSVVSETACVAGKLDMLAVTLPICEVPAVTVTKPIRLLPVGRDVANPTEPMLLPPVGRALFITTGQS